MTAFPSLLRALCYDELLAIVGRCSLIVVGHGPSVAHVFAKRDAANEHGFHEVRPNLANKLSFAYRRIVESKRGHFPAKRKNLLLGRRRVASLPLSKPAGPLSKDMLSLGGCFFVWGEAT